MPIICAGWSRPERRDAAREHLAQNRALLDQIGARFGVQPRFIVALWGIETNFGRRQRQVSGDRLAGDARL